MSKGSKTRFLTIYHRILLDKGEIALVLTMMNLDGHKVWLEGFLKSTCEAFV